MAVLDSTSTGSAPQRGITREERKVIFASSLGTVFEWYDFYLYGSLAAIIAKHFFAGSMKPPRSSSPCWPLPPALPCGHSAPSCSVAWAT